MMSSSYPQVTRTEYDSTLRYGMILGSATRVVDRHGECWLWTLKVGNNQFDSGSGQNQIHAETMMLRVLAHEIAKAADLVDDMIEVRRTELVYAAHAWRRENDKK